MLLRKSMVSAVGVAPTQASTAHPASAVSTMVLFSTRRLRTVLPKLPSRCTVVNRPLSMETL